MSNSFPLARFSPQLLSALRIVGAFLFLAHATAKLFGFPVDPVKGAMIAPQGSIYWVAGWIEFLGGSLLLLGAFTRPIAFLLAGEMAVAYFMSHAPHGFWPYLNGGEAAVMFCFLFLYLAAAGPGPISVDAARGAAR